jgi:hypothetical protein
MTSNNQVSPVIRISQGDRDASARATHLKAASKKYLETTIERKQMSTTTNFKRIALVAVAALGLGVLSSVPSQAVGNLVVTTVNGTTAPGQSDSTTAATISLSATIEDTRDTITVSFVGNGTLGDSATVGSGGAQARIIYLDTTTAARTQIDSATTGLDRDTAVKLSTRTAGQNWNISAATIGNVGAKFGIQIDSATVQIAGTYSFTVFVKQFSHGVAVPVTTSYPVTLVSTAPASASVTASPGASTAVLSAAASGVWQATTLDSTVSMVGTAATTSGAVVRVTLKNAALGGSTILDSLTVSIDKGNLSVGASGSTGSAPTGKSLAAVSYSGAAQDIHIYADGSTGVATLTIATRNAGTFTKQITFFGTAYKAITATSYRNVIGVGTEASLGAISATAVDANDVSFGAGVTVFAYSSDTTVVSNFGTACTYNSTTKAAMCPLTGVKAGTANITIRDKSTVALSTVASSAVAVRVSQGVATSFTLKTDKATYAPGEKGSLWVTVLDAAGLSMPVLTDAVILASGGITSTVVTGSSSDTTTATTFSTERSATPASNDPVKVYTFYAPVTGGPIVFSAKGAAGLSAASQATATTVTATVTDSGAAALAAVTALATTVASLRTLIVTLTNLVLKIQKKVRA